MQIQKYIADTIVNKLKSIINQNINFISINGIIIASTDLSRVGDFHEAALKCAKLKKTIVIDSDNKYKGTKKGINLPVFFDGNTIAVIGITGDKEEVEKYGNIIKQMTEILIEESWIRENKLRKRDTYKNFLQALIFENTIKKPTFIDLVPEENKFIVIAKLKSEKNIELNLSDKIYDTLNINDSKIYSRIFSIFYDEIVFLYSNISKEMLINELYKINSLIEQTGEEFILGISQNFSDLNDFRKQYKIAKWCVNWALDYQKNKSYLFFDEMDIGILLSSIDENVIKKFTSKILVNLSPDEIKSYKKLINCYSNNNGSIKKTSEELFIHKNTLQYRLNKLYKLTGYNPRDLNDFVILKLALFLVKT